MRARDSCTWTDEEYRFTKWSQKTEVLKCLYMATGGVLKKKKSETELTVSILKKTQKRTKG